MECRSLRLNVAWPLARVCAYCVHCARIWWLFPPQRGVSYSYNVENAETVPMFLDVVLPSLVVDLVSLPSAPGVDCAVVGLCRLSLLGVDLSTKRFPNGTSSLQLSAKVVSVLDLVPPRGAPLGVLKPFATILGPSRRRQLVSESIANSASGTALATPGVTPMATPGAVQYIAPPPSPPPPTNPASHSLCVRMVCPTALPVLEAAVSRQFWGLCD